MIKSVVLLAICQALLMSAMSGMISTSALVGMTLASSPVLATLPLAVQFVGMMSSTFPVSLLMKQLGRGRGFQIGLAAGFAGAVLVVTAIALQSFLLFCIGSLLTGVFSAAGQYYRFAAADVADGGFRNNAISLVLAGGVAGGLLGPFLAYLSKDMLGAGEFAGSYLTIAGLHAVAIVVISQVRFPGMSEEEKSQSGRPLSEIAAQPRFIIAVIGAAVGYGVMNLVMTSTPLAISQHGYDFGFTKTVIQLHVVAMFLPSFVTGSIINRFGAERVMFAGCVLLLLCSVVNLSGVEQWHFIASLILLGVGWNFLFIGGTTLVTQCHSPAEKAKTQGLNDLIVFTVVALTAFGSGMLHYIFGWQIINIGVIPFVGLAAVVTLVSAMRYAKLSTAAGSAD